MDFPCADKTWYYNPQAGKCYKLLSDKPNYSPNEAEDACNQVISEYPRVAVQVSEIRKAEDLGALMSLLVMQNVKDKIILNARRKGRPIQ